MTWHALPMALPTACRLYAVLEAASIDKGEVTDKGLINQQAVLLCRSVLVQAPHADAIKPIFKPDAPV